MEAIDNHIAVQKRRDLNKREEKLQSEEEEKYGVVDEEKDDKFTRHDLCVMMEYILIRDINDLPSHAHELGKLLLSRKNDVILNLIPYNPTDVAENFAPPTAEGVQLFFEILKSYGIFTRIRKEMGQDIAGACGQLALVSNALGNVDTVDNSAKKLVDIEDAYVGHKGDMGFNLKKKLKVNLPAHKDSDKKVNLPENSSESFRIHALIISSFALLGGLLWLRSNKL